MGKINTKKNFLKPNSKLLIAKKYSGGGKIFESNLTFFNKAFFPVLGNHDYDDPNRDGSEFLQYFKFLNKIEDNTSNSNKYYDFKIKDCHFFVLDSDPVCGGTNHEGNISDSYPAGKGIANSDSNTVYALTQKDWFNTRIKQSTLKYKFVFQHHPPYNSGAFHRGYPKMSPHQGWKTHLADAVFSGHEHFYERIRLVSQYPNYISVTRINQSTLKIEYSSDGPLFGTSQLRIHIGNDNWQNLIDATSIVSPQTSYMIKENNIWTYYYQCPLGSDYINFVFRSSEGSWDNNIINHWVYDYIYYLNDSNDFSKSTFIVNGNSGHDLRSFSSNPIPQSLVRINDKYGFTEARIYKNGIKYIHYGIGNNQNSFLPFDEFVSGNASNEQDFLFSFAIIADWGNGGDVESVPSNFLKPLNNYYANKIAQEIKNKNINYIFGVGDLSYNGILWRPQQSSGPVLVPLSVPRIDGPEDIDPKIRNYSSNNSGNGSGSGSGSDGSFVGLSLIFNEDQMMIPNSQGLGQPGVNLSVNNSLIKVTDCTISTAKGNYYKDIENEDYITWVSFESRYVLVLYKSIEENIYNNDFWNLIEILDSTDEFGNNNLSLRATNPSTNVDFIPQVDWVDDEGDFFILKTSQYSPTQNIIYNTPFSIDNNVGRFYYDYIPCYNGLYSSTGIANEFLSAGLKVIPEKSLNKFKKFV